MKHYHEVKNLKYALITISTSRYEAKKQGKELEDKSGELASRLIKENGDQVVYREILPDEYSVIKRTILLLSARDDIDVIVTIGGTGPTASDVTIEAIEGILDKRLPGFGEIFRLLTFEREGIKAVFTRALAGTLNGKAVYCIPGSPKAVELAFKEIILKASGHLVYLARRDLKD
ncbi:MAG TPA: MogA/MoaB family molybdenum cofactor biosynthesis protein [Thermoproteales archaeon]|nr:MogA/MoaB family molybdenum cofactor biosynthesis protein [Thermoproteales archaeon]